MIKSTLNALFIFCFLYFESSGQSTFQKVILEVEGISQPTSIVAEADGYLIASYGYAEEDSGLYYRSGIKLVKTDLEGNLIWRRKISEEGKAFRAGLTGSLVKIPLKSYLLGGYIADSLTGAKDYCLFKFDSVGSVVWRKQYVGGYFSDNFFHGSGTSDGGYIMTGQTSFRVSDYHILKTDSAGNQEWVKTYGGLSKDIGCMIYQTWDGGYITSGSSESYGNGSDDLWLIKLDSNGIIQWDKTYGTTFDDVFRYVNIAIDGFVVWGILDTVVNNTESEYTAVIMKLDTVGEIKWRTFFKHNDERYIYQLKELSDGSIVAIGEQSIGAADSIAGWITKLTSTGDLLWERFYPGPIDITDLSYGNSVSFNADFQELPDGFIVAGATWKTRTSANVGYPELLLLKLDTNGCFGPDSCGLELNVGIEDFQSKNPTATVVAYPNPFSTQTLISIKANSAEYADEKIGFQLFDVSGKLLQASSHTLNQYGYCEFYIQREQLPIGMYFYQITSEQSILVKGKLIAK